MLEEPILNEVIAEETENKPRDLSPDEIDRKRKEIAYIFGRHPYLSNNTFNPIISKADSDPITDTNFKFVHPDASLIKADGTRVNRNNQIYRSIDWDLTEKSIRDKVSSLMSKGSLLTDIYDVYSQPKKRIGTSFNQWKAATDAMAADDVRKKRIFDLWREYTARSLNTSLDDDGLAKIDDLESKAVDDYKRFDMESATPQETLKFFNWLQSQGDTTTAYDTPPGLSVSDLDTRSPAIKRGLDESAVSLDTRSSKKSPELKNLTERGKVQYLFDNIDGLNTMKIQPYVNKNGEVVRSQKVYLGPDLKVFMLASDVSYKNQKQANKQINWQRTLSLVIDIVANYIRGYNRVIKAEKDPEKRIELQNEIEDIRDVLKIADPDQGMAAEYLQKLPPSAFNTPAAKPKQAPTISAEKKDFVYEGKGLVGRGLEGAGRPYNLADIEGSGRASDLKYKRIGTKFIRKADLNDNRLKLVFPSRNSVGPLRSMSKELTEMVKDLLYNDNISQQAYRALSVEDQRVFYEIVQKTHVNHTLQTPMIDPRIELKAEFDKLRGEIALGNDNPDMLRELYKLATDMFEQKMITNKQFKSIMSALI
jgi:hypothetical protein